MRPTSNGAAYELVAHLDQQPAEARDHRQRGQIYIRDSIGKPAMSMSRTAGIVERLDFPAETRQMALDQSPALILSVTARSLRADLGRSPFRCFRR